MAQPPQRVPTLDDLRVRVHWNGARRCNLSFDSSNYVIFVGRKNFSTTQRILLEHGLTHANVRLCLQSELALHIYLSVGTLIAHESCLLQWIQSSQADPSRAPNALKCPQCGATYELDSDRPVPLRVLDTGNKLLSILGRFVTAAGLTAVVVSFGTGVSSYFAPVYIPQYCM